MTETLTRPNHAPEPPTEEAPTHELSPPDDVFEYKGDEFMRVQTDTDDPSEKVFNELQEFAAENGQPDMLGLEWVEASGLRYRVSSYEELTRVRTETRKSWIPHIAIHSIEGMELERKEIYKPVTETVDHRTVDVLNADGDLVDILTFTGTRREWKERRIYGPLQAKNTFYGRSIKPKEYDEVDNFEDYFSVSAHKNPNAKGSEVKKSRDIIGFRLSNQQAEAEIIPRGRVAVPEVEDWDPEVRARPQGAEDMVPKSAGQKTQELFESLANQQENLGLHDWQGLTWNSPFPLIEKEARNWNRYHTDQMQIIRDTVIIRNAENSEASYPERVFDVRTRSPKGTPTTRHIYTLAELLEQFSRREDHERKAPGHGPALNLRWETPEPTREAETVRTQGTDVSLEQLYEMWVYPEIYSDDAEGRAGLQDHVNRLKNSPRGPEEVSRVHTALAEQGLSHEQFIEILDGVLESYFAKVDLFGVKIPENHKEKEHSYTWVIHDMEEQLAHRIGNPFEDSIAGHGLRTRIIDRRLGHRFKDTALPFREKPSGRGMKERGEEDKKEFIRIINPDVMSRVEKLLFEKKIYQELDLKKVNEQLEFDPDKKDNKADPEKLGGLLRLSLGEI